jgi:hypothetical protein
MACWNPSTLQKCTYICTNMGLQELPVGIPLRQIPIEKSKNDLLEFLYLTY